MVLMPKLWSVAFAIPFDFLAVKWKLLLGSILQNRIPLRWNRPGDRGNLSASHWPHYHREYALREYRQGLLKLLLCNS
jgi:hypothetical protein